MENKEFFTGGYLRTTEIEVCLLFNFGSEPEIKRKAFGNRRKKNFKNLDFSCENLRPN